jgi:hypothetical protein
MQSDSKLCIFNQKVTLRKRREWTALEANMGPFKRNELEVEFGSRHIEFGNDQSGTEYNAGSILGGNIYKSRKINCVSKT